MRLEESWVYLISISNDNNLRKTIYLFYLSIFLLIISCGQNSSEKTLNGKWYDVDYEFSSWHFYPDSLVLGDDKLKWKATESKIEFNHPILYRDSLDNFINIEDKISVHYQLSNDKDSLYGTLKNHFGVHKIILLRAENSIEFLNKKYDLQFSLPKDDSTETLSVYNQFGLKVFIGYSNNKIVGKTELTDNLNHMESDIKIFKDSILPTVREEVDGFLDNKFHLRVFADKMISDSIITNLLPVTIKSKIATINNALPERFKRTAPDTLPIRIYRIYKIEEDEKMKGKKIKTLAFNVYN